MVAWGNVHGTEMGAESRYTVRAALRAPNDRRFGAAQVLDAGIVKAGVPGELGAGIADDGTATVAWSAYAPTDDLFAPVRGLPECVIVTGQTDAVLAASDLALTASGTATVQTALHDTPMVVVYKLSPLTYRVGRPLVKLDTFAMVNLIAGRRVVPELIQDDFTADRVCDETLRYLRDPGHAAEVREGLASVVQALGGPGASDRAAAAVLQVAEKGKA